MAHVMPFHTVTLEKKYCSLDIFTTLGAAKTQSFSGVLPIDNLLLEGGKVCGYFHELRPSGLGWCRSQDVSFYMYMSPSHVRAGGPLVISHKCRLIS